MLELKIFFGKFFLSKNICSAFQKCCKRQSLGRGPGNEVPLRAFSHIFGGSLSKNDAPVFKCVCAAHNSVFPSSEICFLFILSLFSFNVNSSRNLFASQDKQAL